MSMYVSKALKVLEKIQYGSLELVLPTATHHFAGELPGPHAQFILKDISIIPEIFATGNVGLARTYKEGLWETEDLTKLMQFGIENQQRTNLGLGQSWLKKILMRLHYSLQGNSIKGSARNISAHYDLGNKFYELWLDDSMTYSSGIFTTGTESLQQAQMNKYDRLLNRIGGGSKRVLEVGCGWGGFAKRLVDTSEHKIKGITISQQQWKYAKQRLKEHEQRCQIVLQDYRKQNEKFDSIVSIEMFEAVGEKYWPIYFNKIASMLEKNGKALIQTITISDERFDFYKSGGDMIRSFIFPGGLLPSPSRFTKAAEKAGLKINNKFEFAPSYVLTLENWLQRFNASKNLIAKQNLDEKFFRLWQFYLNFCIAGFRAKRTNVMQVELVHA